jgi:hypothetical protein
MHITVDQQNYRINVNEVACVCGGAFKLSKYGKLGLVLGRSNTTVPRLVSS